MSEDVLRLGEHRQVQLEAVLGEGGFGVVYRGKLTNRAGLEKTVAVKVLNHQAADIPELASRLRDEARMLAFLHHRAIVGVDDLVEVADERWALVMEYVDGVDLERLVADSPIPVRPLCEIMLEAASALQAAHSAVHPTSGDPMHLVHRDIKPGNLRITPGGEVKLLDFGIARATFGAREAHTQDLSFGSVGYMAPERWEGVEDPPSDVYALGIVAIEALDGRVLGQLPVEPRRHTARLHMALRDLSTIPDDLRELLAAMTDYFAAERPSAGEVVSRLRRILATVQGPWLAEWAPRALAELPPTPHVPVRDGDTPTFARGEREETRWGEQPPPGEPEAAPQEPSSPPPSGPVEPDPGRRRGRGAVLAGVALLGGAALVVVLATGTGGLAWWWLGPDRPVAVEPAPVAAPEHPDTGVGAGLGEAARPVTSPGLPPASVEPAGSAAPADAGPLEAPAPDPAASTVPEPRPATEPRPAPVPSPPEPTTVRPQPAPPEPAPARLGELVVDAEGVEQVVLTGGDGRTRYPGTLPTGTYEARVTFTDGVTITVGGVVIEGSRTTTLRCSPLAQTCVIR